MLKDKTCLIMHIPKHNSLPGSTLLVTLLLYQTVVQFT